MMSYRRYLIAAAFLLPALAFGFLTPGAVGQSGQDPSEPSAQETSGLNDESDGDAFRDPAFDRYVDLKNLGSAIRDGDAATVLDLALQLGEGGRVLLRRHHSASSDAILKVALRLAVQQKDQATLDRLEQFAKQRGTPEWKELVANTRELAKTSRSTKLTITVSGEDEVDAERLANFRALSQAIAVEEAVGNRAELKEIRDCLDNCGLNKAETEFLRKRAKDALASLPEDSTDAEALAKLLGPSRGTNRGWVGRKQNGYLTYAGDKYVLVAFRYSGKVSTDEMKVPFLKVVNDAIKYKYSATTGGADQTASNASFVCFGYYNITKQWGSCCLVSRYDGRTSSGRVVPSCAVFAWGARRVENMGSGWNRYNWNPVPGTRYHHRVSYAPSSDGIKFNWWAPVN